MIGTESIQREVYVDASPAVVFDVVSRPEHVREWFADEAEWESGPGGTGRLKFRDRGRGPRTESFTVVESKPPWLFVFRWTHPPAEPATETNSLLVTFDLTPSGAGTLLRLTETGFAAPGRDGETPEERFLDHVRGWRIFLPRLAPYAESLARHHDRR